MAIYVCSSGSCGATTQTIMTNLGLFGPYYSGRYASLKYTSTGSPAIAFTTDLFSLAGTLSTLEYAHPVTSGGNCGVGSSLALWQCDSIDDVLGSGSLRYTSLDLDGLNRADIGYYDATTHDLKLARYAGSGGNCPGSLEWKCDTIDSSGDVGQYESLSVDKSSSNLVIAFAYYDATNLALKVASYSCSTICTTQAYTIFNPPAGNAGMHTSLAIDASGGGHIAFENSQIGSDLLGYAYSVPSGGNCGEGIATGYWQCDTVDSSGSGTIAEGDFTSLAINSAGRIAIAYHEENLLANTGDLKIAFPGSLLFLPLIVK